MASGRTMTQRLLDTGGPGPARRRPRRDGHLGKVALGPISYTPPLPSGSRCPGGGTGWAGGRGPALEPRLLNLDELSIVGRIEIKKRAARIEVLHEHPADHVG